MGERSSVPRGAVDDFGQTSRDLGSWKITQMGKRRLLGSEAIFTRLEKIDEKVGRVCGQVRSPGPRCGQQALDLCKSQTHRGMRTHSFFQLIFTEHPLQLYTRRCFGS